MAVITVAPDQNVFNRNYKGSTLYTRHNSVLMRKKHITKHYPINNVVFSSQLLKKTAIAFKNLSDENKASWASYVVLNPEYKSGINVMTKVNLSSNYALKSSFIPIDSIVPESEPPISPEPYILTWDHDTDTFLAEWEPFVDPGTNFKLFAVFTDGAPCPADTYHPFLLICDASTYSINIYKKTLWAYEYISIKAVYVNPSGLESTLSDRFVFSMY